MNQKELNKIALDSIDKQSIKVATKLQKLIARDGEKRFKQFPGPVVHYVHNIALFECMVWLNSISLHGEDVPEETIDEYLCLVETLRPKFRDVIEALKDFQPTK